MKYLALLFLLPLALLGQTQPQPLQVTRVYDITSPTQYQDNRSVQRQNNYHSFSVTGTGSWSVQMEYSDVSANGPWFVFGSTATITNSTSIPIGWGNGYHNFIRFNTTVGSTVVTYSASKDYFLPTGSGGGTPISFPILISQGGTSATTATAATHNLQFLCPYTGCVARADDSKMNDMVSVLDFAADNTGGSDATAAIQSAIDVASQRTGGGVQVYFPCGTYNVGSHLQVNGLTVSLKGENQTCVNLNYTGTTDGLIRHFSNAGSDAGSISDISIHLNNAASTAVYGIWTNAQGAYYHDINVDQCSAATAFLINNGNVINQSPPNNVAYIQGQLWDHIITHNCGKLFWINKSSAFGTPPDYEYMGYNTFHDINYTIWTGQVGFQVDAGPYFHNSKISGTCGLANFGGGGDFSCIKVNSSGVWDRNTVDLDGEWNNVGGATGNPYSVQVASGGQFVNVGGHISVRQLTAGGTWGAIVPVQNSNTASGSALASVTLKQQEQPSWDNGLFNMGTLGNATPWTAFRDSTVGQFGIMNSSTVHSPYTVIYSATGNRFLFLANNGSQSVQNSVEVGSVDGTGLAKFNGGLQIFTTTGLPTCSATVRGLIWDLQGTTGVSDADSVCIKTSADAYAWAGLFNTLNPIQLSNQYLATGHADFTPVNGVNHNISIGTSGFVQLQAGSVTTGYAIGGFTGGTDGRELSVLNNAGFSVTITNADSGSSPTNRIFTGTGADVITTSAPTLQFKYSSTLGMWLLTSGAGGGGSAIISSPGQIIVNSGGIVQGANTIPASQSTFQQVTSATIGTVQNELAQRVTPQQFGAVANGVNDDSGAINAAITYLASLPTTYTKRLSFFGNYFLNTNNFQISLPYDAGDYANTFTGSLASVSFTVVGGNLTACSVSGGSGYTFSSTLQVQVFDPSRSGTGGHATVTTDGSGVPSACTITTAGINYASVGVIGTVIPIGGDGATATAALVSGSLTTGAATVLTAGSGYTSSITILTGLVCSGSYPTFSSTVSSTGIATVTVVTGGATCTLGGNANATVPLIFGDSCGGTQCSNIPPETPQLLGCAIAIRSGISYEGEGKATLLSNWIVNGSVVDLNQTIPMCDPWGDQGNGVTIKNLTFNGMVGLWFSGALTSSLLDNLTFAGGVGMYAAYTGGTGQGNNFASTSNNITNTILNGAGGLVFGGNWVRRNGMPSSGSGSIGGIDVHNGGTTNDGGTSSGNLVRNLSANTGLAVSSALDIFFETYVWKFQNGPATIRYGINGQSVCYGTQSVVDRTTDFYAATANNAFATLYPWSNCYYGVTGTTFVASNRFNAANYQSSFDNIHSSIAPIKRPIIYGNWVNSLFNNIVSNGSTGTVWADPYTNSAAEPGFISIVNGPAGLGGSIFSNITTSITAPFTTLVNHSGRGNTDQTVNDTYLGGMSSIGSSPITKFPGTTQFGTGIGSGPKMIVSSTLPSGTCVNGSIYLYTGGTGGLYVCQSTAWVGPK